MTEMNQEMLEKLIRKLVMENLMPTKNVDPSGILSIKLPEIEVAEEDRLDTGNPADIVYTKDLVSLQESPRLGCGLMVMKDTTFDWTLEYDEVDYIISGQLIICYTCNSPEVLKRLMKKNIPICIAKNGNHLPQWLYCQF